MISTLPSYQQQSPHDASYQQQSPRGSTYNRPGTPVDTATRLYFLLYALGSIIQALAIGHSASPVPVPTNRSQISLLPITSSKTRRDSAGNKMADNQGPRGWTEKCLLGDESLSPSIDGCTTKDSEAHAKKSPPCPPLEELPRQCLLSKIPLNITYRRLACCFRCCLRLWHFFLGMSFDRREHLLLRRHWPFTNCHNRFNMEGSICNSNTPNFVCCSASHIHAGDQLWREGINITDSESALTRMKNKHVMFTVGDRDVPNLPESTHWFLDHPKMLHVFAQNIAPGVLHPKLSIRPRTLYEADPPVRELLRAWLVKREDEPFFMRPNRAVSNFTVACRRVFNPRIPGRKEVIQTLEKNGFWDKHNCTTTTESHSRQYHWTDFAEHVHSSVFLISPRGWGQETPKAIEAMALGTIPIVAYKKYRQKHQALWEGLPIVKIEGSWDQLNDEVLTTFLETFRDTFDQFDLSRIFLPYWLFQISQWFQPEVIKLKPENQVD